ncbi:MAG: zinc ABC transporter substrate-binding protein [Synechococcus sp. TMED20]|jgi:zinc/manganese transport system substrate-binding protein|nr:MAG: zinc ABC transporter substrate-binding protein [Synechococcus sp. TMED20]
MSASGWFRFAGLASAIALGAGAAPVLAAPLTVVAVDGTLCDLTRTLAGSSARVTCLIPPGGDPHGYRLKPSDRKALSKAALVVHIGFNLTPAAKKISSSGKVVAVGEVALPSYRGNDPHVWHDPANSAAIVTVVANNLAPLLPAGERAALGVRASKAKAALNALGSWGSAQFSSLPKAQRVLVTDHQTYSHLAKRYGLEEISMLDSYTTGGVLRPSSLNRISSAVKASGARIIFTPSLPPNKTLRRISKRTGLPISKTPIYGEGVSPGGNAVSTATVNICTIVIGQGGRCDKAAAAKLAARWKAI